ncbi:MAG: hypothetical protein LBK03_06075 [Bacteroidales bacterium]|jgi:hypothetical protein|nr:hypothetical protein [Bacteroidales bacterium]
MKMYKLFIVSTKSRKINSFKNFLFVKAQRVCKRGTGVILCIALILFAAASCEKPKHTNEVKLSDFKFSECKVLLSQDAVAQKSSSDTIYAETIDDNTLKIWTTNTLFSCCASEIRHDVSVETIITVILSQSEDGNQCNCLCGRSVEFLLNNLINGQNYSVIIKKDIFDYYSFDFTFSNQTSLTFTF